jgi:hypothetical protein
VQSQVYEFRSGVKKLRRTIANLLGVSLLLLAPVARAQVQAGDDVRLSFNGLINGGYSGNYGDDMPSSHGLTLGGSGQLNGSFYDPNFLNFSVTPYYNQSRADSSFQSLTDASGVGATANVFSGSRYPGSVSYHYDRDNTGTFGLMGVPNFTTVGTSHGFGIGWSALIPDWPTFSASYSQGSGTGTIYGTDQVSSASTKTLNLRSSYQWAGWHMNANYQHLDTDSRVPAFLTGQIMNDFFSSSGNSYGINGNRALPWNGSLAVSYTHSNYSGDFGTAEQSNDITSYSLNQETINAVFHPTTKWGIFASQSFIDNLDAFVYQQIINGGGGVPITEPETHANSSTLDGGVSYNFTPHLYGQAQVTYFDQNYLGQSYQGSYFSGSVGYDKRILDTFTVSASVIDSTNKFTDNALGFVGNLNAYRHFGLWEFSGGASYAQNVQTLLVTYTTSYYRYNGNVHRSLGRGTQWTGSFNGSHTGFSQQAGTVSYGEGISTSLAMRRYAITGNYTKSRGQSVLTSTGIQPITTPGLLPLGLIVYNGESYGVGISATPLPRLVISGTYSHATSETLNDGSSSNNRTEIFYTQLQYHLRQITAMAGYTKFSQGISAAGVPPGNQYSYYIGVTRSFNFF